MKFSYKKNNPVILTYSTYTNPIHIIEKLKTYNNFDEEYWKKNEDFLKDFFCYCNQNNKQIIKYPVFDGRIIDFYALHLSVKKYGGSNHLTKNRQWTIVTSKGLGIRKTRTDASFRFKNIYYTYLVPYLQYRKQQLKELNQNSTDQYQNLSNAKKLNEPDTEIFSTNTNKKSSIFSDANFGINTYSIFNEFSSKKIKKHDSELINPIKLAPIHPTIFNFIDLELDTIKNYLIYYNIKYCDTQSKNDLVALLENHFFNQNITEDQAMQNLKKKLSLQLK